VDIKYLGFSSSSRFLKFLLLQATFQYPDYNTIKIVNFIFFKFLLEVYLIS